MLKQIIIFSLAFFLTMHNGSISESKRIEIFNIETGKVVKIEALTPKIKALSIRCLNNISGICTKLNPIPTNGIAIKILFQHPLKVHNKFLPKNIEELIVMFPKDEPPLLMTFDEKYAVSFFYFKGDASLLLKAQ